MRLVATIVVALTLPAVGAAESLIAYTSTQDGNSDIHTVRPDGSRDVRLTDHPAVDEHPAWSGDGRQIAFVSERDGARHLWLVDADGSGLTRLTGDGGPSVSHPSWSPDGDLIVFQGGDSGIWQVRPDGGGLESLGFLSSRGSFLIQPVLGSHFQLFGVIVVRPETESDHPAGILHYAFGDVIGHGMVEQNLRNLDVGFYGGGYSFCFDADGDIWSVDWSWNLPPVNLTESDAVERDPSWSPGLSEIAYESEGWIWIMDTEGVGKRRLVSGAQAAWSPLIVASSVKGKSWGQVKMHHSSSAPVDGPVAEP